MRVRAILCDDEPLALQRLGDMVARIEGVDLVGAFRDGEEVIAHASGLRADVVFLDVEMPGLDGFDVVEALARQEGPGPLIVFATAYPRFATLAYETGAIDFLTKPVRMARLETAIQRVRAAIEDRSARSRLEELSRQLETLRQTTGAKTEEPHVWIQRRGEAIRVLLDRIDRVHAEAEYVRIVVGQASYLHREPLSDFLERLDSSRFVRVHRSLIVNRQKIASVRRTATGSYRLTAEDGTELPVGRSYRRVVKEMMGASDPDRHAAR